MYGRVGYGRNYYGGKHRTYGAVSPTVIITWTKQPKPVVPTWTKQPKPEHS